MKGLGLGLGITIARAEGASAPADVSAPTLSSATIGAAGNILTLVFNETVVVGAGGNGGWTIIPSAGTAILTYASGSGSNTLVYNISRVVYVGETATFAYTQPGSGIEDAAGNDLASIGSTSATNSSAVNPVAMDMYISGDGATGAITTGTMAAGTTSADAGAWALPDNAGSTSLRHEANGNLGSLRSAILVNGTIKLGVITNGLQLTPATFTTDRVRRTITGQPEVLIGFFFRANVGAADFNVLDFLNLEANGGANWSVAQWKNYSPPIMRGHSAAGTVDLAAGTGTDNQIYWVQVKYSDSGNLASVAVWTVSGSTYTLIDAQTILMTTANSCTRIFLGLEAHGVTSSDVYNWCNIVVKWNSPGAYNTLML